MGSMTCISGQNTYLANNWRETSVGGRSSSPVGQFPKWLRTARFPPSFWTDSSSPVDSRLKVTHITSDWELKSKMLLPKPINWSTGLKQLAWNWVFLQLTWRKMFNAQNQRSNTWVQNTVSSVHCEYSVVECGRISKYYLHGVDAKLLGVGTSCQL
jgi:hypothetical protein